MSLSSNSALWILYFYIQSPLKSRSHFVYFLNRSRQAVVVDSGYSVGYFDAFSVFLNVSRSFSSASAYSSQAPLRVYVKDVLCLIYSL